MFSSACTSINFIGKKQKLRRGSVVMGSSRPIVGLNEGEFKVKLMHIPRWGRGRGGGGGVQSKIVYLTGAQVS